MVGIRVLSACLSSGCENILSGSCIGKIVSHIEVERRVPVRTVVMITATTFVYDLKLCVLRSMKGWTARPAQKVINFFRLFSN